VIARTHDTAALAALLLVTLVIPLPVLNLSTVLLALLANQIGGIVPDIDQPTAPLWRNLPIGKYLGRLVGNSLGGHRFLTHSILGVVLFGFLARALLGYLTPLLNHANTGFIWWAFMIGMISHLLLDSFTKEGVPLFLPLPVKVGLPPLKKLRITTGKNLEKLIILPLLLVVVLYLVASNYAYFVSLLQHVS
jgi:inner membrane protein